MLERFKVPEKDRVYVPQEKVRRVTEEVFKKAGMDEKGSQASTDVLITNDLRGNETHGVSNGLRRYAREYGAGNLNAQPEWKIVRETSTTANVDADGALGIHVGPWANELAIEKAREHGIGAVTVFNTGHLAGCGYYVAKVAEADMIGHCMTSGSSGQTIPTWGAKPYLGTNPIAWGAPARKMHPYLFDVATTQIANNKVRLAQRIGTTLLPGWITDTEGNPIMEEIPAPETGTYHLLHIGGTRENGSHKGFGLALMNEIMCNGLSGYGPGPILRHQGSHFFAAYRIDAFTDLETFKDDMDRLLEAAVNIPPAKGQTRVVYPGVLEAEEVEKRSREGIPYHREVIEWFEGHCAEVGIDCDLR